QATGTCVPSPSPIRRRCSPRAAPPSSSTAAPPSAPETWLAAVPPSKAGRPRCRSVTDSPGSAMGPSGPADFLGRGWGFPTAVGLGDEINMVADEDDIRQAIRIILETDPGERVMRPDFGAGLRRMVFEPINTSTMALVRQRVEAALVAWEPRIEVQE